MKVSGMNTLAAILGGLLISTQASAQDKDHRLTPADFEGVQQIICEWKPESGGQAIPKIEATGLKVRPGLAGVPYGVCPLAAAIDQATLGKLYEINEIVAVYPDLKIPVKLDEDTEVRSITKRGRPRVRMGWFDDLRVARRER